MGFDKPPSGQPQQGTLFPQPKPSTGRWPRGYDPTRRDEVTNALGDLPINADREYDPDGPRCSGRHAVEGTDAVTINPEQFTGWSKPQGANPQQLKMFMTPAEIMDQYQTLPGDRKEKHHVVSYTYTMHTGEQAQYKMREGTGEYETNEQTWARKGREAAKQKRGVRGGETLQDSIAAQGVKSPVHLGITDHSTFPDRPDMSTFLRGRTIEYQAPSTGQPAVVGGHHRIAAAAAVNPNQFIPVIHHEDIWDARTGPWTKAYGQKYQ